jgi:fukutin
MKIVFLILFLILLIGTYIFYIKNKLCNNIENFKISSNFIKRKQEIYNIILKKTSNVMNRLNIPFFLSSGTLLGYYREGKILDHDYDLDVGIFNEDFNTEIINEMKKEGFVNYRNLGNLEKGYEMSFRLKNSPIGRWAKIDIFVHNKEIINGKKYIYWASYKKPSYSERIKYRVSDFYIKPILFNQILLNIPINTEKYLEEHYGLDWKIPKKPGKKGYYYATSPVSIVKEECA